jgi:hypothetical protein
MLGGRIIQCQFCRLLGEAHQRCSMLQKTHAFRSCVTCPITPDIYTDQNFLPFSATGLTEASEPRDSWSQREQGASSKSRWREAVASDHCHQFHSLLSNFDSVCNWNYSSGSRTKWTGIPPKYIFLVPKRSGPMKWTKGGNKSKMLSSSSSPCEKKTYVWKWIKKKVKCRRRENQETSRRKRRENTKRETTE